jgi:alpha-ketoglutarate-dependent taurine dioxygenase
MTTPTLQLHHRPGTPAMLVADQSVAPDSWAAEHRAALRSAVAEHGAVLVRGLGVRDRADAAVVFQNLGTLMPEREAFAPRRHLGGGLYTSTPWAAAQQMCMHHEMSYTLEFPGLMLFACLSPPAAGGATSVADAAAVVNALPPDLVDRFAREGWLLCRTYNDEIGASWTEAFGTADQRAVEAQCRAQAIEFSWLPGGGLRTWQRRLAIVRHPRTGRYCWFNQIAFLNEWTLDPDVREFLVDMYGPDALPFTTRFGNGEAIGPGIVELINQVYVAHTLFEPWRAGDVLLVDNIGCAHGRAPFEGAREVVTGLADPVRLADCAPVAGGGAA